MWTALTFYWGSGAVWPRCTHRQHEGGGGGADAAANACGEPLLVATQSGVCSKRACGREASWRCIRINHDFICKHCLWRQQDGLIGAPGVQASTDIYDAVIERETTRREQTIYLLRNLVSRKPPKIAPNFKTSNDIYTYLSSDIF